MTEENKKNEKLELPSDIQQTIVQLSMSPPNPNPSSAATISKQFNFFVGKERKKKAEIEVSFEIETFTLKFLTEDRGKQDILKEKYFIEFNKYRKKESATMNITYCFHNAEIKVQDVSYLGDAKLYKFLQDFLKSKAKAGLIDRKNGFEVFNKLQVAIDNSPLTPQLYAL